MRVAVFSTKSFERMFLGKYGASSGQTLVFFEQRLTTQTIPLAVGFEVVCDFTSIVNPAKLLPIIEPCPFLHGDLARSAVCFKID